MLSVSFLMTVISPLLCFSRQSSSRFMDVSRLSLLLARPLPPSFLVTYSLSTLSLGCNVLCMVISFLVLWSICLNSSLVHLRKGPEYSPSIYSFDKVSAIEFCLEYSFLIHLIFFFLLIRVFRISDNCWSFTRV